MWRDCGPSDDNGDDNVRLGGQKGAQRGSVGQRERNERIVCRHVATALRTTQGHARPRTRPRPEGAKVKNVKNGLS